MELQAGAWGAVHLQRELREGFLEEVPSKRRGGALVILTYLALTLCQAVFSAPYVN